MTSVTEGIETGPLTEDPNTVQGFAALLEGKGVERTDDDGESSDTSIASGLTTATPDQPRGPDGKFVSTDSVQTPPVAVADTGAGAVVTPPEDDEVAAYLARYNGDTAAALKAAANLVPRFGEQGAELGKTREELAELRGMVTALTQTRAAEQNVSPLAGLSDDQVTERAQSLVENKGYAAAATEAANLAHTTGDERAYKAVIESWQLEDAFTAMDFHADFRQWQKDQKVAAVAPAEPEAWMVEAQQTALNNTIGQSFKELTAERGGKEAFAPIMAFMDAALDQMPENVAAMIASTDPEARLGGLRIVADRATLLAGASTAATTVETPNDGALPPAVQRKLSGSAVATGALKPPAATPSAPQNREEAITAFKKELLETETTSVAAGLTYAGK